ncbi:biotin synthase [Gammaproteobacteria bacterium]|nr:MAG: biotin synthase BioB [Gammaproteobacteria bacterium]CAG0944262.1 biotin synthase [Gammaproteobacteria bacterium]
MSDSPAIRNDWTLDEVWALASLPFNDLLFRAHSVHRQHFDPNAVQISTLVSVKTGGCPEDCAYCPQSVHYDTGVDAGHMMDSTEVLERARAARAGGATRFCMGAAWRSPRPKQVEQFAGLIREVSALGLETCATLGMLSESQARQLKEAGLDYYNHNLDTSERHYPQVISTRSYRDRLETLQHVRTAGLKVCCGGIIGLGEALRDRVELLHTLATLPAHPDSVPINQLVQVEGTPLAGTAAVDPLDFVRVIALARILMPASHVRLSAGRTDMSDEMQALCFFAGANSLFFGERLLTTPNPAADRDRLLLDRLGLRPEPLAAGSH